MAVSKAQGRDQPVGVTPRLPVRDGVGHEQVSPFNRRSLRRRWVIAFSDTECLRPHRPAMAPRTTRADLPERRWRNSWCHWPANSSDLPRGGMGFDCALDCRFSCKHPDVAERSAGPRERPTPNTALASAATPAVAYLLDCRGSSPLAAPQSTLPVGPHRRARTSVPADSQKDGSHGRSSRVEEAPAERPSANWPPFNQ